uniref:ER membrane protein complex subunit 1 n=1 Tax=Rhodosorus marinus TaxID=101924 RepID=A0A7S0G0G1_9RHOD|mmetsp:Transcript_11171/g.16141  ORF Transcript_11171/g.16141 Transcript_11171/m.16141 type:complete len:558 (+) Transcript_11171:756-2429(+)
MKLRTGSGIRFVFRIVFWLTWVRAVTIPPDGKDIGPVLVNRAVLDNGEIFIAGTVMSKHSGREFFAATVSHDLKTIGERVFVDGGDGDDELTEIVPHPSFVYLAGYSETGLVRKDEKIKKRRVVVLMLNRRTFAFYKSFEAPPSEREAIRKLVFTDSHLFTVGWSVDEDKGIIIRKMQSRNLEVEWNTTFGQPHVVPEFAEADANGDVFILSQENNVAERTFKLRIKKISTAYKYLLVDGEVADSSSGREMSAYGLAIDSNMFPVTMYSGGGRTSMAKLNRRGKVLWRQVLAGTGRQMKFSSVGMLYMLDEPGRFLRAFSSRGEEVEIDGPPKSLTSISADQNSGEVLTFRSTLEGLGEFKIVTPPSSELALKPIHPGYKQIVCKVRTQLVNNERSQLVDYVGDVVADVVFCDRDLLRARLSEENVVEVKFPVNKEDVEPAKDQLDVLRSKDHILFDILPNEAKPVLEHLSVEAGTGVDLDRDVADILNLTAKIVFSLVCLALMIFLSILGYKKLKQRRKNERTEQWLRRTQEVELHPVEGGSDMSSVHSDDPMFDR